MRVPWTVLLVALASSVSVAGFERQLDRRALEVAQALARSPNKVDRQGFHAPYRVQVGVQPVDYLEVITPFRRAVLAAEAAVDLGQIVTQRDGLEALGNNHDQLDVIVELTFHPLNTFIGVPDYTVTLVSVDPGGGALKPRTLIQLPWPSPRLGDPLRSIRPVGTCAEPQR